MNLISVVLWVFSAVLCEIALPDLVRRVLHGVTQSRHKVAQRNDTIN